MPNRNQLFTVSVLPDAFITYWPDCPPIVPPLVSNAVWLPVIVQTPLLLTTAFCTPTSGMLLVQLVATFQLPVEAFQTVSPRAAGWWAASRAVPTARATTAPRPARDPMPSRTTCGRPADRPVNWRDAPSAAATMARWR